MNSRIIQTISCLLLLAGLLFQTRQLFAPRKDLTGMSKSNPIAGIAGKKTETDVRDYNESGQKQDSVSQKNGEPLTIDSIPRLSIIQGTHGKENSAKLNNNLESTANSISTSSSEKSAIETPKSSPDDSIFSITNKKSICFTEGISSFPVTFNPLLARDVNSRKAISLIFASMVRYDPELHICGDLAESWVIDRDTGTLTFNIRKNAFWHNGNPVTAEDVKETFEAAWRLRKNGKMPDGLDMIRQVTVIDEKTISVLYKSPWARMLDVWTLPIVSSGEARAMFPDQISSSLTADSIKGISDIPMGSGPFIPSRTDGANYFSLIANHRYHLGDPAIDTYTLKVINISKSPEKAEEIDLIELPAGFDPSGKWASEADLFIREFQSNDCEWIWFNLSRKPFSERNFRTALAIAVDRQSLLKDLGTRALLANGPFLPLSWASNPDIMLPEYDPQEAREKIQSILNNGLHIPSFTILTDDSNPWRQRAASSLARAWTECGLTTKVVILPWNKLVERIVAKDFSVVLVGFELGMDPDQASIWHSSPNIGLYNISSFKSDDTDRLIEQGRCSLSTDSRRSIYHSMHEILARELPCIFLFSPYRRYAISDRSRNLILGKLGHRVNFHLWKPEN